MATRKRRESETYEQYHKNLKDEDAKLKRYLKGRVVWNNGTYRKTR